MSGTVKTVLVVGGVLAGAYVVYKLVSPSGNVRIPQPAGSSSTVSAAGLVGSGISAIASIFAAQKNSGSTSSPNTLGSATDQAPTLPENFDPNNFTTSNGFMFTDASGNFVAG